MTRTALVLQNQPSNHLGSIGPLLSERGYRVEVVETPSADLAAIDPLSADLAIVLGGAIGVNETAEFPFLDVELSLLRRRLDAGLPTLGICLGAQLLAAALGARVYPGEANQIGFRRVTLTEAGAGSALRHFVGVPVMQWHGDTFDLPDGATRLASSDDCATEAFAVGDVALAVQFHPELTDEMHERWLAEGAGELAEHALDADALRLDWETYAATMQQSTRTAFGEWLDGLSDASRRTP